MSGFGGCANGRIDRILIGLRTRQRRQRQHPRTMEAGQRDDFHDLQLIARQRPGLVSAQDVHGGSLVHRGEPRQQDAAPGERLSAECGRQRERRGKRRRNRGKERGQGKRDEVAPRQCRGIGVNDNADRDGSIHEDEIARRR